MTDLSTNYMGLQLRTPLVASASPLSHDLAGIRQLEDAGASAIVLYSLFEEQIRQDERESEFYLHAGSESCAESLTYFPTPVDFRVGPQGYLNHILRAKDAVNVPIIASLNGSSFGGWTGMAKRIEQAGADAIECNIYFVPSDMNASSADIEKSYTDIFRAVKHSVDIPVAVKLRPLFYQHGRHGKATGRVRSRCSGALQPLLSAGHRSRTS
jgi:dihydroorotate dehydrogenase (fumarate)